MRRSTLRTATTAFIQWSCLALVAGISLGVPAAPVHAATFTVTSTGDGGDSNTADGVCDDGTGKCTLRAAIQQTNATAGTDTIAFNIPAATDAGCNALSGVCTVTPASVLPTIADPIVIDGYSQPGTSPNTLPNGNNAVLLIELAGTSAGVAGHFGLSITSGGSTVRGLVINRFDSSGGVGIVVSTNGGNVIEGNFIGIDVSGTASMGNGYAAYIDAPNNRIGGTTPAARNVISGNDYLGVLISGSPATGNLVEGNFIGTNAAGTAALPNGGIGVEIDGASGNTIGGTAPGAGNVISANGRWGVQISPGGNSVQGNLIGTDVSGTVSMGNGLAGVSAYGDNNIIGGTSAGAGNVISGNNLFNAVGVEAGPGSVVQGNLIGTDITGTLPLGNGTGITAAGTRIGGTTVGARNIISGNGIGVSLGSDASVEGNFIGTDITGTVALGNSGPGVSVFSGANNTIGGTVGGARNVISGNSESGVQISNATGNRVEGNFIGTDVTGTIALGNDAGIQMSKSILGGNSVGGTAPGAGNVISGNRAHGVVILGAGVMSPPLDIVQGNLIGTRADGFSPLGNGMHGVYVADAKNNAVGGPTGGAGNTVAYNGGDGVLIEFVFFPPTGNLIASNSIFSNTALGIDLGSDGVTPNDVGDGDTGPNNLQNFPVLTSITTSMGSTTIDGTLNSAANTSFTLEFFYDSSCDPSGFGEGRNFIGSSSVLTAGTGDVGFSSTFSVALAADQFITATATDAAGNTSEFSQCAAVVAAATPTPTPTLTPTATRTSTPTPTPTASATHVPGGCDRADLTGDGRVTTLDVMIMAIHLGRAKKHYDARFDIDMDGKVTAIDLVIVVKCRNAEKRGQH